MIDPPIDRDGLVSNPNIALFFPAKVKKTPARVGFDGILEIVGLLIELIVIILVEDNRRGLARM